MVEYSFSLDDVFGSLADPTRRDILQRVSEAELSVSQIATVYDLTYAAISKHLKILEKANLIRKRRQGKETLVTISPGAFAAAEEYLTIYRQQLSDRFDNLESYLNEEKPL